MSYAQEGTLRWAKRMGGASDDNIEAVAVSSTGTVFIVANFRDNADFDGVPLTSIGESDIAVIQILQQ